MTFAQRWEEFRGAPTEHQAELLLLQGLTRPGGPTMPVTISDLSLSDVTPLAEVFTTLTAIPQEDAAEPHAQGLALRSGLSRQQTVLSRMALKLYVAQIKTGAEASAADRAACSPDTVRNLFGSNPEISAQDERELAAMGVTSCDAVQAYGAVLNSAQRGLSEGSWNWMVERGY